MSLASRDDAVGALARLKLAPRLKLPRQVYGSLAMCLLATGTAHALELGDATIRSGLGQALVVQIPYRLAASEQIAANCVSLTRPLTDDGTPAYTATDGIEILPTHIQVFGSMLVREPLIGLHVRVQCPGVPHIVRSYVLFVDPPAQAPIATYAPAETVPLAVPAAPTAVAVAPVTVVPRGPVSPRASGTTGGAIAQGEFYRVVRGDTLSGIASRIADRPGNIWQTADAVFAANPTAFTNGNPDLIQEGREILIPLLDGAASAALAAADIQAAPPVPAVARSVTAPPTPIPAPAVAIEPEVLNAAPAAQTSDIVDIAPVPAAAPAVRAEAPALRAPAPSAGVPDADAAPVPVEDVAAIVPSGDTAAGPVVTSSYSFLAIGAGLLLLLSPLFFMFRRRNVRGPFVRDDVKTLDLDATIPSALTSASASVSAASTAPAAEPAAGPAPARYTAPTLRRAPAPSVAPSTPSVDEVDEVEKTIAMPAPAINALDVHGMTVTEIDPTDLDETLALAAPAMPAAPAADKAYEAGSATIEDELLDASTILLRDVEAEFARRQVLESADDREPSRFDGGTQTMTLVDLDLLRQDYEAELTLTQLNSPALRDAVADLKVTEAALAAGEKTAVYETLEDYEAAEAAAVAKPKAATPAKTAKPRKPRKPRARKPRAAAKA